MSMQGSKEEYSGSEFSTINQNKIDEGKPGCACVKVKYDPVRNENGTCSERWLCLSCKTEFIKKEKT